MCVCKKNTFIYFALILILFIKNKKKYIWGCVYFKNYIYLYVFACKCVNIDSIEIIQLIDSDYGIILLIYIYKIFFSLAIILYYIINNSVIMLIKNVLFKKKIFINIFST